MIRQPVALQKLLDDHQVIVSQVTALVGALNGDAPAAALRHQLEIVCAELLPHLLIEDIEIYPPMRTGHHGGMAEMAADAIARFDHLHDAFQTLRGEWPTQRIAQSRADFVAATLALIDDLTERVRTENQLLYPMALRFGLVRLRSEAA